MVSTPQVLLQSCRIEGAAVRSLAAEAVVQELVVLQAKATTSGQRTLAACLRAFTTT